MGKEKQLYTLTLMKDINYKIDWENGKKIPGTQIWTMEVGRYDWRVEEEVTYRIRRIYGEINGN